MPRVSKTVKTEEAGKIVKKLPSSETGRSVHYTSKSRQEFEITQNPEKSKFTLWKVVGFEKVATADSPYDLYPLAEKE